MNPLEILEGVFLVEHLERIFHWFPIFHCYVSFSWFLAKGQVQNQPSSLSITICNGCNVGLNFPSLDSGYMIHADGREGQWQRSSNPSICPCLCSMTATLGAPSPPALTSNSNIITQRMQRLCRTTCSHTNFMRRLLHRCSCFCCLDKAILNTWATFASKFPIRKNWKLWNKLELSMVLLMLQNSCKMLRLSSILNSSAASHVTLAMQGFMMFGCVCLCDFSLSWN